MTANEAVATDLAHALTIVLEQIPAVLGTAPDPAPTAATPIGEGGLEMESLSVLELAVRVEKQLGCSLSDEDLDELLTSTVGGAAELFARKTAAAAQ